MKLPAAAVLFGPMRLPFLLLTPACLAVGVAAAWRAGATLDAGTLGLLLLGGVAAHVSVNALNEYADARSGLDRLTTPTPFSGGSQALPRHPGSEPVALATGSAALLVAAAVGLFFVLRQGPQLFWVGVPGLFLLATYTPWITRNAWLCLVAPGLGFGLLMVAGAAFSVAGFYPRAAWLAALVPFFLVNNLLLLNQLPDREPDRQVGRRHLVITRGPRAAVNVYALQLAATYGVVVGGWLAGWFPVWTLLALLTVPVALRSIAVARRVPDAGPELIPALGMNVLVDLATPALLALGLFLGGRVAA